jgi:hypothetical protein
MPDEGQYTGLPLHYLLAGFQWATTSYGFTVPLLTLKLDGILV